MESAFAQPRAVLDDPHHELCTIAFSPDGRLLAAAGLPRGGAGGIVLWDAQTSAQVTRIPTQVWRVNSVVFSPDGNTVAAGCGDDTVRLYDLADGKEIVRLEGHTHHQVVCVAYSPDGETLASGGYGDRVRIWDAHPAPLEGDDLELSGQQGPIRRRAKLTLAGHKEIVRTVAFSPGGELLASAGYQGLARLWEVRTGREISHLGASDWGVSALAFAPDGKTLALAGSQKVIRLWDWAAQQQTALLKGHTRGVNCVAFFRDGRTLVSGSNDDTIKIWDLASDKVRATLRGHSFGVLKVVISPDGKTIASFGRRDAVLLWEASEIVQWPVAPVLVRLGQTVALALTRGQRKAVADHLKLSPELVARLSQSEDRVVLSWNELNALYDHLDSACRAGPVARQKIAQAAERVAEIIGSHVGESAIGEGQ